MKSLLFLLGAVLCAQTPRQPLFPVGGVVVDSVTGKPVRGVSMVIAPTLRKDEELARTVSDDSGKFAFQLPQGSYELRAERLGVRPQAYQQEAFTFSLASSLIVKEGEKLDRLVFRLRRPSAITGTVRDEFDEPVQSAKVYLFESAVRMGRRSFVYRQYAYTNHEGRYRLHGLDNGSYWLMVEAQPWYSGFLYEAKEKQTYGRVVYPDAADFSSGSPLVLGAGESGQANFRLKLEKSTQLDIKLPEHPKTRKPVGGLFRVLIPSREGHLVPIVNRTIQNGFTPMLNLQPGNYRIQFISDDDRNALSFDEVVAVAGDKMELPLQLHAPLPVTIRTRMEGPPPPNADLVFAQLSREETGQYYRRQVNVPGEVTFDFLESGNYFVQGGSRQVYIHSSQIGDRTLDRNRFELNAAPVTVDVTFTTAGGRVRGIVKEDNRPTAGAIVVLGRLDGKPEAVYAYTFQTDSDGSYDWPQVRPGTYSLFVLRSGSVEFFQPSVFAKLRERAKTVTVADKAEVIEDLELR